VVERLLAANAAVNVQDRFGDTPLIGACNKGFDGIAQLLVEKGADPSLKDQEGRTAAQRADESSDYCRTLGGKAGAAASAPAAERDAPRANGSAD